MQHDDGIETIRIELARREGEHTELRRSVDRMEAQLSRLEITMSERLSIKDPHTGRWSDRAGPASIGFGAGTIIVLLLERILST